MNRELVRPAGEALRRLFPMTRDPIPPEWPELLDRLDKLERKESE